MAKTKVGRKKAAQRRDNAAAQPPALIEDDFAASTAVAGTGTEPNADDAAAQVPLDIVTDVAASVADVNDTELGGTQRNPYAEMDLYFLEPLIEGTFGGIYVATNLDSQTVYVSKVIDLCKIQQQATLGVMGTTGLSDVVDKLHEALDNHVANQRAAYYSPDGEASVVGMYYVYDKPECRTLVMEYMQGGNLYDYLYRRLEAKTLTFGMLQNIIKGLLVGVQHLHQNNIVHRDVHPENLLLQDSPAGPVLKISNFFCSKLVAQGMQLLTRIGKVGFVAPEVCATPPPYGFECDIWSAGVVIHLMLLGTLPAPIDMNDQTAHYRQAASIGKSDMAQAINELVSGLLTVDPKKRLSAQQALGSKLFSDGGVDPKWVPNFDVLNETIGRIRQQPPAAQLLPIWERFLVSAGTNTTNARASRPFAEGYTKVKGSKMLGQGSFGKVYEYEHNSSMESYAVKIIKTENLPPKVLQSIRSEIEILRIAFHGPHLIGMLDSYEEDKCTYLVMNKMQRDVFEEISARRARRQPPSEIDAAVMCECMFAALDYLHSLKICHRDVKPHNMLLKDVNDFSTLMLADYGVSKKALDEFYHETRCGTYDYKAPEVHAADKGKGYGWKADMWSAGVTMYWLLMGEVPFARKKETRNQAGFPDEHWKVNYDRLLAEGISDHAISLMKTLLKVDVNERISADKAAKDWWFVITVQRQKTEAAMRSSRITE